VALNPYSAGLKLDRARKHITDLEGVLNAYKASRPYRLQAVTRPGIPLLFYCIAEIADIPDDVTLVCADALQNLKVRPRPSRHATRHHSRQATGQGHGLPDFQYRGGLRL